MLDSRFYPGESIGLLLAFCRVAFDFTSSEKSRTRAVKLVHFSFCYLMKPQTAPARPASPGGCDSLSPAVASLCATARPPAAPLLPLTLPVHAAGFTGRQLRSPPALTQNRVQVTRPRAPGSANCTFHRAAGHMLRFHPAHGLLLLASLQEEEQTLASATNPLGPLHSDWRLLPTVPVALRLHHS